MGTSGDLVTRQFSDSPIAAHASFDLRQLPSGRQQWSMAVRRTLWPRRMRVGAHGHADEAYHSRRQEGPGGPQLNQARTTKIGPDVTDSAAQGRRRARY